MYPRTHTHTHSDTLSNDTTLTHRHTFNDTPTPTFIFTFIPLSHTTTPAVSMVNTMFLMLILIIFSLFYFNVVLYLSLYCRLMKLVGAKISVIKSCLHKEKFGTLSNLVQFYSLNYMTWTMKEWQQLLQSWWNQCSQRWGILWGEWGKSGLFSCPAILSNILLTFWTTFILIT